MFPRFPCCTEVSVHTHMCLGLEQHVANLTGLDQLSHTVGHILIKTRYRDVPYRHKLAVNDRHHITDRTNKLLTRLAVVFLALTEKRVGSLGKTVKIRLPYLVLGHLCDIQLVVTLDCVELSLYCVFEIFKVHTFLLGYGGLTHPHSVSA